VAELIPLFVAIPLGAAFLMALLGKLTKGTAHLDAFAVLVTGVLLAMAVVLVAQGGDHKEMFLGGWNGSDGRPIGIAMACDGLSRLLLITVLGITFAATVFGVDYMRRFTSRGWYYTLFLLMVAGMCGVVLSGDLFNIFVFMEVAAISSYALVAFGVGSDELEASFKYLVLGSVASALVLLGIGIIYNMTGQLNLGEVKTVAATLAGDGRMPAPMLLAVGLFITGFGLKAAMVPFHAWLPDAHPSAPAPISAMLSGVLIKAIGIYPIARLAFTVFGGDATVGWIIVGLGAVSMLIGVLLAVGQWDFKRLLAYHSISQMGYVMLGLGTGAVVMATPAAPQWLAGFAVFGGLFHLINHAAFKSLLFLASGSIEQQTGTRHLKQLGGLTAVMPWTSVTCRVAALSISGVPPFNGFWSKLIIILAVVQAGLSLGPPAGVVLLVLGAVTVLVSFLTLVSFVKVQRYALHGPLPENLKDTREARPMMRLSMGLLALTCAGIGILVVAVPAFGEALLAGAQRALTGG
jgi:multicomponent Na+:H+ antiporter subunit D